MMMDPSKKSNKIRDIVRLQQILKKWKKVAASAAAANNNNNNNNNNASSNSNITSASFSASTTATNNGGGSGNSSKLGIKFLKRTLSFTDFSSSRGDQSSTDAVVPKGFLAVCVGKELKRFIIPTEYLGHQVFEILLREAEEEFGFQQEGVLKIPCDVPVFEKILKVVEDKEEDDRYLLSLQGSMVAVTHQIVMK